MSLAHRMEIDRSGLLKRLRQTFAIDWNGLHGIRHWARVRLNGRILAKETGANPGILELFAFFHDSCRINEYEDHDHGARGAKLAQSLRGQYFECDDAEMALLVKACDGHSNGGLKGDITVQTCWDADRLDLGRVGIRPNPKYLCTNAAKNPSMIESACRRSVASPHMKQRFK